MHEEGTGREFGWYAFPPPGHTEDAEGEREPAPVEGPEIRMMGEWGVTTPLWDANGPLDEDPDYLSRELGISQQLIADLAAWGEAWETDLDPAEHNEQGRRLFARLQAEINPRFRVTLHL